MANTLKQTIGVGTVANDGLGDPIRTGGQKSNTNFTTLFRGNKVIISLQTSLADFITNEFDTNETFTVENGTIIEITNASSEKEYYLKYQNTGSLSTDYVNINSVGQFVHLIGNETIEGNKRFDNFITQNFTDIASVQDIPDISGIRNTLKITGNTNVQTMNPGTIPQGTIVYIYANEAFTIEHLANGSPNEFYFNSGEDYTFSANEIALFCLGEGQIWTEISMNSVKGKWKDDGTYLTIRTPRIAKFSKRVEFYQGADLFSQNNLTLGEDGNYFKITTITNQIQLIESNKWQKGSHIALELAIGARVKHLATASSTFYPISLASGSDFQAVQKTVLELYLNEDNIWIEANGTSLTSTLKTDFVEFNVNITDYTTQSSGITLKFTSGTNTIDWGDGSTIETFTTNVEKTHSYTVNSTYRVRIISTNLGFITSFVADTSRISGVVDFTKLTGLTGNIELDTNLITQFISNISRLNTNFSITGNSITNLDCPRSNVIQLYSNSSLSYINFQPDTFNTLNCFSTAVKILDLSNVSVTALNIYSNTSLTDLYLNQNSNSITSISAHSNTVLKNVEIPQNSTLTIDLHGNTSMTSLKINIGCKTSNFRIYGCTAITSIDLSNLESTAGYLDVENCTNLATLTPSYTPSVISTCWAFGTKLATLDLSNYSFSGSVSSNYIQAGGSSYLTVLKVNNFKSIAVNGFRINGSINLAAVQWSGVNWFKSCNASGCALTEAEVDEFIAIALDSCVSGGASYYSGTLTINGGTNAAPSATGLANIATLVAAPYNWTITHN